MKKYAVGLDYGTLSVRALFLDLQTGEEAATAVYEYPHGIMEKALPDGTPLPEEFALEHPMDFLDGMGAVIAQGMARLKIGPAQIVGLGLDVTSSTVLPVDEKGWPLCLQDGFSGEPHAWMKLWKHHGASQIAQRLTQVAQARKEPWLQFYGGSVCGEFLIAKAVELAVCAPAAFEKTYSFVEAADWLVWLLTGNQVRSLSLAGCTGYYRVGSGYPSREFFREAYKEAEKVPDKLQGTVLPLGSRAGYLQKEWAEKLGLEPGTPVGIGTLDSHIGVIGCGASRPGDMVAVIGTSACAMLNAREEDVIPGIYLGAQDANVPGFYGYEGSQNCVGDMLGWFVDNCVPRWAWEQAQAEGLDIHTYLMQKAALLQPGESGLLALDWFNGNRTPLMDLSLTGCILGLTVQTQPEELYRALLESAAFGFRRIVEHFEKAGKPVERIIAGGGIPAKNPLMMQLYADICGKTILICGSSQASALGSAVLGAAAAGPAQTGCKDIPSLMEKYVKLSDRAYTPRQENRGIYDKLYGKYLELSDVMAAQSSAARALRQIKQEINKGKEKHDKKVLI